MYLPVLKYRTKLLLGILLVGISAIVAAVVYQTIEFQNFSHERDFAYFTSTGQFLADMIAESFERNDTNHLLYHIKLALVQPDVVSLSVIDLNGIVIFSSDNKLQHKLNPYVDSPDITRIKKERFFKTFTMMHEGETLAYLQVGYSLGRSHNEQSKALKATLSTGFFIIIMTSLAAWIISGVIRGPLRAMQTIAQKLATGDFTSRLSVQSKDEIGALGNTINEMSDQLHELTKNMQQRIDRTTADLKESNDRLKEMDRLKSMFVSMVSHDFKAPLASIVGFADTLRKSGDLPAATQQEYLTIIRTEGMNLAAMADRFLNTSKLESGNFEIYPQQVNVNELISEVTSVLQIHCKAPIKIFLKNDPPLQVNADPEMLKVVFMNVIENAIKYTKEEGNIRISARMQNDGLLVGIEDDGPGISSEDSLKIFDKFYRGGNAGKSKGFGLGLAIVKSIVEAHGGRIWCDSELGKGTTITFCLPTSYTKQVFYL
jgi:signal transduction histidine kinase